MLAAQQIQPLSALGPSHGFPDRKYWKYCQSSSRTPSTPTKATGKPLWPWPRTTAHRKITRTMADAGVESPRARRACGMVLASRPSPPACRCRRSRPPWATPTCKPQRSTPPPRVSRRGSFWLGCGIRRRIRPDPAPEGLRRRPVARMARVVARKVGPPCELQTLLEQTPYSCFPGLPRGSGAPRPSRPVRGEFRPHPATRWSRSRPMLLFDPKCWSRSARPVADTGAGSCPPRVPTHSRSAGPVPARKTRHGECRCRLTPRFSVLPLPDPDRRIEHTLPSRCGWYRRPDSNGEPLDPQSSALTYWSYDGDESRGRPTLYSGRTLRSIS